MIHTKLALDIGDTSEELDLILDALDGTKNLQFQNVITAGSWPSYPVKSPEQIVKDYLRKGFNSVLGALKLPPASFPEELIAQLPVDIVVTIPAVCHCIALYVQATKFDV